MYNVKYKVDIKSSVREKLHSFQVCKFNPMEKYILGRIGLYFGGFREKCN